MRLEVDDVGDAAVRLPSAGFWEEMRVAVDARPVQLVDARTGSREWRKGGMSVFQRVRGIPK